MVHFSVLHDIVYDGYRAAVPHDGNGRKWGACCRYGRSTQAIIKNQTTNPAATPEANPEIAEMIAPRSLTDAATTAEAAIPMVGAIRSSICAVCPQKC